MEKKGKVHQELKWVSCAKETWDEVNGKEMWNLWFWLIIPTCEKGKLQVVYWKNEVLSQNELSKSKATEDIDGLEGDDKDDSSDVSNVWVFSDSKEVNLKPFFLFIFVLVFVCMSILKENPTYFDVLHLWH